MPHRGTLLNFPAKFTCEHIKDCPMHGIYLLEVNRETIFNDLDDDIAISLNALTASCRPGPCTSASRSKKCHYVPRWILARATPSTGRRQRTSSVPSLGRAWE